MNKAIPTLSFRVVSLTVAAISVLLRAWPLLQRNGAQNSVAYDEGVYLSAAGLLAEGRIPYSDFVLLHPPGILLLAWPMTSLAPALLDWHHVLYAARWLGVLVGAANVLLLIRVVARWRGPTAGIISGALYAGYRPAIAVEQHLMLEPFVVLFILLAANMWLAEPLRSQARRAAVSGGILAFAGLIKLTGGLALLALLVSAPRVDAWRARLWATAAAAGMTVIVLLPFAILAGPGDMWEQVVIAQVERPGEDFDGGSVNGLYGRLAQAGRIGPLSMGVAPEALAVFVMLGIAFLAAWAAVRGGRDGRFWGACLVALLTPSLLAPDWYEQYPVPAALAMCALLGAGSSELLERIRRHRPSAVRTTLVVLSLAIALGLVDTGRDAWRDGRNDGLDFAARVKALVPPGECLVAEPPNLALAADRLPSRDRSGTYLIDPFGSLLVIALDADVSGSTPELITSPIAQERLKLAFGSCRYVALGREPGTGRMSEDTADWFLRRFERMPAGTTPYASLWRRSD